jgi:crotonobetaine/carnitine-CoA ligase
LTYKRRTLVIIGDLTVEPTTSVLSLFDARLSDSPHKTFARYEGATLTYLDLDHMIAALTDALKRDGVASGDVVAALMRPSLWHLALAFACWRSDAIWAPINIAYAPRELNYTLEDLAPSVVFGDPDLCQSLPPGTGRAPIVEVSSATDHATPTGDFASWLRTGGLGELTHPARPSYLNGATAIMYSGGTTGLPKGIVLGESAIKNAMRYDEVHSFREHEVMLSCLQFSHGWTPLMAMPFCLYKGYEFAFTPWWSAGRFVERVRAHGATLVDPFIGMIGTYLKTVATPDDRNHDAYFCAAAMGGPDPQSLVLRKEFERRFGVETRDAYGSTETGALVTIERDGERRADGTSGRIGNWYEVSITDDYGRFLPPGAQGSILVRPRQQGLMALGYLNRPDETLTSWRDLYVHTGDVGYVDDDGYLYFVGRKEHFLRRRGELVSVGEVEQVLASLEGVEEVAVVGVPSEFGEDDIAAFVVVGPAGPTLDEIAECARSNLARFKLPAYISFVDELPRTGAKQEIERHTLARLPTGKQISYA